MYILLLYNTVFFFFFFFFLLHNNIFCKGPIATVSTGVHFNQKTSKTEILLESLLFCAL